MERKGIAAVGDKDSVSAFKAVGVDAFPISAGEDVAEKIKELGRTYAVIFVTEDVAKSVSSLIERYKSRPYPVILPIPSAAGSTGFGFAGMKKDVERAIGSDFIFRD